MLLAVLLLTCAAAAIALWAGVAASRARPGDGLLAGLVVSKVLVTLVDGAAFEGLLRERDGRSLVLVDAAQVSATGDRLRVGGELLLPRDRVAYLQKT